jgi:hypothetical protein
MEEVLQTRSYSLLARDPRLEFLEVVAEAGDQDWIQMMHVADYFLVVNYLSWQTFRHLEGGVVQQILVEAAPWVVKGLEVGSALFAPYRLWFFCLEVVLAGRHDLSSCLDSLKLQNLCVKLLEEAEEAEEPCLVEFQLHSAQLLSELEPREVLPLPLPLPLAVLEYNWR